MSSGQSGNRKSKKKADALEDPQVIQHVGLLVIARTSQS
jgi:hypothetical protein